jgi:hypothetical protein
MAVIEVAISFLDRPVGQERGRPAEVDPVGRIEQVKAEHGQPRHRG